MSQQPFQDIAVPRCDVADAAEGGDGGIPGEIKGVCAESDGPGRCGCPAVAHPAVGDHSADHARGRTRGAAGGCFPAAQHHSGRGIARIGWGFAVIPKVTVTPFASYPFAQPRFGGYSETNGVFAASFEGFTSTTQTSRVGGDARYTFATNAWALGTLASDHRPDGGKGANISGTLIDAPFSYTAPGLSSARDWAEVGGAAFACRRGATARSRLQSPPRSHRTDYVSRLGVVQAF